MKALSEQDIKKKIEELKEQRDKYVLQVNQQLAAFNGAIQAYELLIAPEEKEDAVAENGDV
jgi:hypothetical protein